MEKGKEEGNIEGVTKKDAEGKEELKLNKKGVNEKFSCKSMQYKII